MPTDQQRYDELSDRVLARYREQRFADGLALIDEHGADLPGWRSDLAHTAACLHALSGDPDAALRVLRDAADGGAWWHPRLLLEDDDLAGLAGLPGFPALVEQSRRRWAEAQDRAAPLPPVVVAPDGPARGVVAVLHGAGQSAGPTAATWEPATVGEGFLLVAVESSQLSTPTYRTWPDQAAAARDVAAALATLDPPDRAMPLVAAGFSAGARAALLWAVTGEPTPVTGFVAVAPAVQPDLVAEVAVRVPPGLVLIGGDDELVDEAAATVARLPGVELDVVPGLAHDYPEDFADRLARALRRLVPPARQ